ncbi:hypothetical protein EJB05_52913, partial [Eragrostis curvula]
MHSPLIILLGLSLLVTTTNGDEPEPIYVDCPSNTSYVHARQRVPRQHSRRPLLPPPRVRGSLLRVRHRHEHHRRPTRLTASRSAAPTSTQRAAAGAVAPVRMAPQPPVDQPHRQGGGVKVPAYMPYYSCRGEGEAEHPDILP